MRKAELIKTLQHALALLNEEEEAPAPAHGATIEDLRNWLKGAVLERAEGKPEKLEKAKSVIIEKHGFKSLTAVPADAVAEIMQELGA